ncbi:hypothetical protein ACN4EE_19450 [Geminocystis sp. CENA526]|uniref:hypothetical protein n=1 Tax=Geminocystis sp. CENA526 TaxID=1355871 RepID=UPI003D6EA51E
MEKLTRDILGQTFHATVDTKKTTGKILAIANFVDKQQVCIQVTEGKNGIWIPTLDLGNVFTISETKSLIKEKKVDEKYQPVEKIGKKERITITEKKEEEFILLAEENAKEDLDLQPAFYDDLLNKINNKVSKDIEVINQNIEDAQQFINKLTKDFQDLGKNHLKFLNDYLNTVLSHIKNLVEQISQTIQNIWAESLRESIALIMRDSSLYFNSAKRKINYLKKTYPQETNRQLAGRLTHHLTIISLKSKLFGHDLNTWETLKSFYIELELLEISSLLTKLIYGVAILHGFDKLEIIDIGEIIGILGLCLTIDSLKELGLDSLIQSLKLHNPLVMNNKIVESTVKITFNAVSNIALFQMIRYASYLYYDVKTNDLENPLTSVEAYQKFTQQIQSYLNKTLNQKDKLLKIVKNIAQVEEKIEALA